MGSPIAAEYKKLFKRPYDAPDTHELETVAYVKAIVDATHHANRQLIKDAAISLAMYSGRQWAEWTPSDSYGAGGYLVNRRPRHRAPVAVVRKRAAGSSVVRSRAGGQRPPAEHIAHGLVTLVAADHGSPSFLAFAMGSNAFRMSSSICAPTSPSIVLPSRQEIGTEPTLDERWFPRWPTGSEQTTGLP